MLSQAQHLGPLDVGECPIGTYGTGGATGAVCATCASLPLSGAGAGPYSTTLESGSTKLTDCDGKLAFSSLRTGLRHLRVTGAMLGSNP